MEVIPIPEGSELLNFKDLKMGELFYIPVAGGRMRQQEYQKISERPGRYCKSNVSPAHTFSILPGDTVVRTCVRAGLET